MNRAPIENPVWQMNHPDSHVPLSIAIAMMLRPSMISAGPCTVSLAAVVQRPGVESAAMAPAAMEATTRAVTVQPAMAQAVTWQGRSR